MTNRTYGCCGPYMVFVEIMIIIHVSLLAHLRIHTWDEGVVEGVDEGLLTKGVQMPEADPSSLTPTQVAPSTHVSAPARKHHKQCCSTTKHSSTCSRTTAFSGS